MPVHILSLVSAVCPWRLAPSRPAGAQARDRPSSPLPPATQKVNCEFSKTQTEIHRCTRVLRFQYCTVLYYSRRNLPCRTIGPQRGTAKPPHVRFIQEEVRGSVLSYMYIPCPACMRGGFRLSFGEHPSTHTHMHPCVLPGRASGVAFSCRTSKPNQTFWTLAQPRPHADCRQCMLARLVG